jgi:hypothetical protein
MSDRTARKMAKDSILHDSMRVAPIFARVFRKLYGHPCWLVKPGYAGFLTMEFGEPHLEIREPTDSHAASKQVRELFARRMVTVRGDWHLWICWCDWAVFSNGKIIGELSTTRRIQRAAHVLDGQKLISFSLGKRKGHSVFEFDLGARLETLPYDRKSEQWMLFTPTGRVLTLRADDQYSYEPGDTAADSKKWKPVRGKDR